jgi:ubiquinone/menaquinone biosynthesis C-methylase UbiE
MKKIASYFNFHDAPELLLRFPVLIRIIVRLNQFLVLRNWYVHASLKRIVSRFQGKYTLLDVGAGMSDIIIVQSKTSPDAKFYGMDLSASNIRLASAALSGRNNHVLMHADITIVPFPGNIDVAVSITTLQYIHDDELVLRKIFDALNPSGTLLLYVPVHYKRYLSLYKWLETKKGFDFDSDVGRAQTYSSDEILSKITKTGFLVEKVQYTYGKIGAIGYEMLTIIQALLRSGPLYLSPFVLLFYCVILPLQLCTMVVDFMSTNSTGNGVLIQARKGKL